MRRRTIYIGGFGLLGLGLVAMSAKAYVIGYFWANGGPTFRINAASFTSNMSDISFTQQEALFWVTFGMQHWKHRTRANIDPISFGLSTKTFDPDCNDGTPTNGIFDGNNDIYMSAGCYNNDPTCPFLGVTVSPGGSPPGSTKVEADVCFYANAGAVGPNWDGWRVRSSDFIQNNHYADFAHTVAHELGHWWGVDHTPSAPVGTLMESALENTDGTMTRYPFGDDIAGMHDPALPYGTYTNQIYARAVTGNTAPIGPEIPVFPSPTMVGSTLALRTTTDWGLTLAFGTAVTFARTNFPLTGASTWSFMSYPAEFTERPIAVAGRTTGAVRHVAAWTRSQSAWPTCSNIRIGYTTNNFNTMTTVDLTNDCSIHDPAVVFDPVSQRFILFYVRQAVTAATSHQNDVIMYRTSPDGTQNSWTSAQPWGASLKAIDAVSAACSVVQQQCMLSYTPGNSELPVKTLSRFTVSSAGIITIAATSTSATYGDSCRHFADAVGVYHPTTNASRWVSAQLINGCNWNIDNIRVNIDGSNPMTIPFARTLDVPTSTFTRHRPSVAAVDTQALLPGGFDLITMWVFYQKE